MAGVSLGARGLLYFHTIRHLKPMQIVWRARRNLPSLASPDTGPAPAQRRPLQPLVAFPRKPRSMVAPDTFSFLNQTHRVAAAADWNNRQWDALWRYNLHYFDDLCAQGAVERAGWHQILITRWIAENPVGQGCGWDPYPTSLRIVKWIKWALGGNALDADSLASLSAQVRYLERRIEWHLLGNHLLANAKALVFGGLFFSGREADRWLERGMRILADQLLEQVLLDGGHFERSPMYHALVLEDVLDLVNVLRAYPERDSPRRRELAASLDMLAPRMLAWLEAMCHPDGGIAFFNDAALGTAPTAAALREYARALGVDHPAAGDSVDLADSGYVRFAKGDWCAIFDAASVGPDYQPGHAHADTLSFELSVGRERLIVNSGTSTYEVGPHRAHERSTRAHNTVEIDGENSSEVWASFRVARRARPFDRVVELSADRVLASCAHDGYKRLRGAPIHRRTLDVTANSVQWTDRVEGSGEHTARGFILLHPDVTAEVRGASAALRTRGGLRLALSGEGIGGFVAQSDSYAPEFGLVQKRTVLAWEKAGPPPFEARFELRRE